ncbi:MAG: ThuA domain-containing protein [Verrucomicrobiales bacterium]|nr:ThuA domain-containing protein [Verrucomicrobiales bacterium]
MKSHCAHSTPRLTPFLAPALALACLSFIALAMVGCGDSTAAKSADSTKIIFISGQPSHPSGQHEFFAGATILANALENESGLPLDVEVIRHGWPEDDATFDGADAVIIYSDGNSKHPVNGHEEKMDALAKSGVGIMFMHYGVEVPKGEQGDYFKQWIGGHYEAGFSVNPHWTAEVELDADHPISKGVPGFTANDEWYYNMRFADPDSSAHILTAVPTTDRINRYIHWTPAGKAGLGKRQTMMWAVTRADGGRGVGFTGGHWHRNWALDDFRKVVLNAIVWVAKGEVPESGVRSNALTEAQLNENLDEKEDMVHVALPSEADLTQPPAEEKQFHWPGKPKPEPKGKGKGKTKAKGKG